MPAGNRDSWWAADEAIIDSPVRSGNRGLPMVGTESRNRSIAQKGTRRKESYLRILAY